MGHLLLSHFLPATAMASALAAPAASAIGLMQFLKKLENNEVTRPPAVADSKTSNANTARTVLSLVNAQERTMEDLLDEETDGDKRMNVPYVEGKMHLPPHWRHASPVPVPAPEAAAPVSAADVATVPGAPGEVDTEGKEEEELPLD